MSNDQRTDYPWEDAYVGESQGPNPQAGTVSEQSAAARPPAEILQHMLKDAPEDAPATVPPQPVEPPPEPARFRPSPPPKEQPLSEEETQTVPRLLLLAGQAEEQARMTEEAAKTAGDLAQQMLVNMQKSDLPPDISLQQLSISAGQNAVIASEAAMKAQLGAMEVHAAAVNQSLAELEQAKELLQQYSRDYIQQSKQVATAEEEAQIARDLVNKARLEHAAKHNIALGYRDTMLQLKMDYDKQMLRVQQAQENLEKSQRKAQDSQHSFQELQKRLDERRKTWQGLQKLPGAATRPVQAPPPPVAQPAATSPPVVAQPPAAQPAVETVTAAEAVLPAPIPAPPQPLTPPAPPLSPPHEPEPASDVVEEQEKRKGSWLATFSKILIALLVVIVLLQIFVFKIVMVDGTSMSPTISARDYLISSRVAYLFHEPERGDIIILHPPDVADGEQDGDYIKRIIALPNEHLVISDGEIYINDQLLNEPYLNADVYTQGDVNTVVPDGYYYVLGDNRPASRDSRAADIGPIAKDAIRGKAILRVYPFHAMGLI